MLKMGHKSGVNLQSSSLKEKTTSYKSHRSHKISTSFVEEALLSL